MKAKFLLVIFLVLGLWLCVRAEEIVPTLTDADVTRIKNDLNAFDKGEITLNEITTDRDKEWGCKLVAYYETHTNAVTSKMKLPISRCYGAMGKDSEAVKLAEDYVAVFSNDWHGWRIIGSANIDLKKYNASVSAYTNAVGLGDYDGSCIPLAIVAMKINRMEIVRDILPQLFDLKESKTLSHKETLEAVGALVLYSLRTNQKEIFIKAIDNVKTDDILSRNDLKFLVKKGCEQFKGADINKIRKELEAASSSGLNSTETAP